MKKNNQIPEINKRFLQVMKENGYTAYRLAKEVSEISQSKMTHLKSGRNEPSSEMIRGLLSVFPDTDYNWLLTGEKSVNEPLKTFKPEGKVINVNELPVKDVIVIPIKGRGGLENAFYDDLALNEMEVEKLTIKKPSSKGSKWFKIEVEGVSMDDSTADFEGSKYSLCEGDWAFCRSIPKTNWRDKLHFNRVKVFCFFHNTRGIIFKKVIDHNTETGEIVLRSLNKDKKRFPDFKINIAECSYICNVLIVQSEF